jgi:hypothetical protein
VAFQVPDHIVLVVIILSQAERGVRSDVNTTFQWNKQFDMLNNFGEAKEWDPTGVDFKTFLGEGSAAAIQVEKLKGVMNYEMAR